MLNENRIIELYEQRFDEFCTYAYILTGDFEASKDIVQDVFVEFWEHFSDHPDIINPRAYFIRAVKNRSLNHLKGRTVKDKYRDTITKMLIQSSSDAASELEIKELSRMLQQAIDKLPTLRARIFNMSREEGKTYTQIAVELSISIKTVESHISKAIRFLKSNTGKQLLITGFTMLFR